MYQGKPQFKPIEGSKASSRRSTPTRTSSNTATCTTCASRACGSCRARRTGPWEVASTHPGADLHDPGELTGPSRHLRHRRRRQRRRVGDLRVCRRVYRPDDRMGLRRVGQRLLLSALRRLRRVLPGLLSVRTHLRDGRLVQPVHAAPTGAAYAAYGPYGGVGMGASYNPRTGTYARGAAAYGPYGSRAAGQAYNPRTGSLRTDTAGLERLRQLGHEPRCSAATTGRRRHTSRTTGPAPPRPASAPAKAVARSRAPDRAIATRSAAHKAATSTPAATATSIGATRAEAGNRAMAPAAGIPSTVPVNWSRLATARPREALRHATDQPGLERRRERRALAGVTRHRGSSSKGIAAPAHRATSERPIAAVGRVADRLAPARAATGAAVPRAAAADDAGRTGARTIDVDP